MNLKNSLVPPSTNRGVENTTSPKIWEKINYINMIFDWIQCTIYSDLSVYSLFNILFGVNTDNVFVEEKGVFGYNMTFSFKNIKIMLNSKRDDMGYHLLCSGMACRDIENLNIEYIDLFNKLSSFCPHYTRIDVSIDSYTDKYFTVDKIKDCIKNNEVVSKFKNSVEFNKTNLSNNINDGLTIWFGSRSSNIQIVFYDKLKERKCADVPLDKDIKFWQRLEVRFRNEYANDVIVNFVHDYDNFNNYYFGIISNYVCFCKFNASDVNRSRWFLFDWWSDFLTDVSKVKIYSINVEKHITNINSWLDNSVSRSLLISFLADVCKDNVNFDNYIKRLRKARFDISINDLNFINDYRSSKNLDKLSNKDVFDIIDKL